MVSFILLVVGGLNWLVFALSGWDVGQLLGGMSSMGAKIVYVLVGLAAISEVLTHKTNCRRCTEKSMPMGTATQQM